MESERVVVQSPTSFVGSGKRIWRLARVGNPAARWLLAIPTALVLIALAWVFVAVYTLMFGVLLVPWRLIRRGSRKRKLEEARHREQMDAINRADA